MSDPFENLFDLEDPDTKERALAEASAQLEAGQGIPQEAVLDWLVELAAGRWTPPPCR